MATTVNRLESAIACVSPYMAHQKVRYATYALGILSVSAASYKVGSFPIEWTIIPASLFVIYQKNRNLLTAEQPAEKASRLAHHCFVAAAIWGIVLSGTTLTLGFQEGKLLVHGALSFNPLEVLKALNSLSSIGWYWASLSFYLLSTSDKILFMGAENFLKSHIENFLKSLQADLKCVEQTRPPLALVDWAFKSEYKTHFPAQFNSHLTAFESQIKKLILHLVPPDEKIVEDFDELKKTFLTFGLEYQKYRKTPIPSPDPFPPDTQHKIKKIVCGIFHYSFTALAALLPLYVNPLPTIAGLGLGWFYPLGWQSEEKLKKWAMIPNFFTQTFRENCYYIWKQSSQGLNGISRFPFIAYPMALSHGFLWAETLHYYVPKKA